MAEERLPKGITLRKDGRYMARFTYDYQTYTLYNRNLRKLEKELAELRYEIEHGLRGKADNMTLTEWFSVWIKEYKSQSIKETTLIRYKEQFDLYVKKELGFKKLGTFKPLFIQRHVNKMAEAGYSTKTIADTYSLLHGVFNIAVQNDLIIKNPCMGIVLPKTKTKERRVLTMDEQKELLCHAKKRRSCEPLIRVALGTGLRAGELLGLTWDDIDFEHRELRVNKTLVYLRDKKLGKYRFKFQTPKTKNGTRTIPMSEDVYQALKRQRILIKEMEIYATKWEVLSGFEDLVFLNSSGHPRQVIDFRNDLCKVEELINETRKRNALENGSEYIPIPHINPHALRHTFATRCFEAGIDAKVVQGYLGHYSISITLDIYTHVTEDKARTEMDKLEALYQGIG